MAPTAPRPSTHRDEAEDDPDDRPECADVAILILAAVGLDALLTYVSARSFNDDRDQSAIDSVNA